MDPDYFNACSTIVCVCVCACCLGLCGMVVKKLEPYSLNPQVLQTLNPKPETSLHSTS